MKYKRHDSGFTLIEILIVMVIIGIGFMTFTPKFAERTVGEDPQIKFFRDVLEEHYNEAKRRGEPIALTGFKGSANILKLDGTRVQIPGGKSVASAYVNDENQPGLEYKITVYPDRLCDYFKIEFTGGGIIESMPILLTVRKP